MSDKIPLFNPYKSVSVILKLGVFNSSLTIGSGGLLLAWLCSAAAHLVGVCLCGKKMKSFLFIDDIFPAIMSLDYLLKWLVVFLISVLLQISILSFLATKKVSIKSTLFLFPYIAILSLLHNLPGLFLILVLMSRAEYSTMYKTLFVISIPLLFIFKISKHRNFILYPESVIYELVSQKIIKKICFYFLFAYSGYLIISTGLWVLLLLLPLNALMLIVSLFQ